MDSFIQYLILVAGALFWTARWCDQLLCNFRRKNILELSPSLNRRPLAVVHARATYHPILLLVQLHITIVAFVLFYCQASALSCVTKDGRWDVTMLVIKFLSILIPFVPSMVIFNIIVFEGNPDYNYPDCLHKKFSRCDAGVGIAPPCLVLFAWVPLAVESYAHQGRSVSVASQWAQCCGIIGALLPLTAFYDREEWEVPGIVFYGLMALAEFVLCVSHLIWLSRTRKYRQDAAAQGITFDELADKYATVGFAFPFAASRKWTQRDPVRPRQASRPRSPDILLQTMPPRAAHISADDESLDDVPLEVLPPSASVRNMV
ncbi:hypothetical protein DL766_007422 [Monosporascus sp. MC13-8B]|uniref:Uncharacterized protein n=1 Tax=Monosporascus cannonballus TaxID=155416 RepID=A0ABY0H0Z2_9PEZI|nr:hypothetical protein DL762_007909 [Monosporascus cannonballus]RYO98491.1 hypothetical protein DL763_002143 [Monosporascus cannonballus]RYP23883.1 hypothetical protein DL766_007422 [Monosporascus sp. MC13-8B]